MEIKRNNQLLKKILAIFLTILMIATTIPLNVFAASSNMNLGEKDNNATISVKKETHYGHELHTTTVGGETYPLFCIEYGKTSPSSSSLGTKGKPSDSKVLSAAQWIFAGYYMEHGNDIDWLDMAYCQKKVWAVMGSNTSWSFSDTGYNNWIKQAEQNMKNIEKKPSFNGTNVGTIKAGEKLTITDTNGVLKDYPEFTNKDTSGVTISHSNNSNNIVITVDKTCTNTNFSIPQNKYRKTMTGNGNDCLLYNPKEGGTQKLLYSAYYDPVGFDIHGNVQPLGNLQLKKTSEDGKVSGINFTVTGPNGFNRTIATDGNGEWKIEGINPGTYTVTEESINKYVPQNSQTVTVEGGNKTATVTFSNVLKRGSLSVIKDCEDNLKSGLQFHLTGTSLSGIPVDEYATTDSNGVATFSNILIGSNYTIQEVNTPIKYVVPANQTGDIEWNSVTNKYFTNKLKKFRVSVNKQDIEKTHSQGDAKLGGAIYGLYHGDTLVAQYTTQNDGTFTTDYFVCDTNWTLKEIQPSEGYLLDKTVYQVGADPQLYTVEYNWTSNTVKEQVKKGKVSIIKHTDDGSTKIETPEKGAEFQLYLKSSGSFVNADPDERDTIICDEDGFASSKLLPYGVYTVHQTKGWDGREKITDFDVFIQSDNVTYKFLINNANFSSYLKVVKLDKETNKQIPYAGAAFEIYDADGHRISMKYTYPQVTTIHTFYTNSEGYLITPEKLEYGDYKLVEVQAPYGYVLDSTPIAFSINQENSSTDTGVTVVKVKAKDIAQKGVIEITKTGEVFSSVNSSMNEKLNLNTYMPIYEKGNLKDAVYEIYAAEDITTTDGTVRAEKGELVDTITTGDKGIAKSKELYLGKYTIIEKTAPLKFVLNKDKHNVELTYAGQNIKVTSTALSVYNERQKVSVSLSKTMEQDEIYGIGNNNEIKSVQFGIFADEDVKAADGTIIPKDSLVTFANCDENGKITFDCDLPIGYKWYAKEIATDEHYILSNKHYQFNTNYAGQDTKVIKINVSGNEKINNTLKRGKVEGIKINKDNDKLEGAIIGIFKVGTTEFSEKNAIATTKTDKDGAFSFSNIPYGEWIVKEVVAPTGYVVDATQHHIHISDDGVVINITMTDKQVQISKTDITGEKEVVGAELTITDESGNVVDSWTSTDTVHYANGLVEGQKYTLTEKTAPLGYAVATSVEFVVSTDKVTQQVTMVDKQVLISKTDVTSGQELAGAELTITDERGNVIDSWTSTDTAHYANGLVEGQKYTLTEKTAPYGYEVANSIVFVVTNDKATQTVVMNDSPILSSVLVNKVDSITGENIISKKFEFTLYSDVECKNEIVTVNANTDDGTALFSDLRYGTYYIKETKAPKGYMLSDEVVKIEINDKGVFANGEKLTEENDVYSIVYQNSLLPSVFTGDTKSILMYLTMAAIAVVFIAIMIIIKKKYKG